MAEMEADNTHIVCVCSKTISQKCSICRIWFCDICAVKHQANGPSHKLADLKTVCEQEKLSIEQRMGVLSTKRENFVKLIKRLNDSLDEDDLVAKEALRTSNKIRMECMETINNYFDKIDEGILDISRPKSTKTKEERDRLVGIEEVLDNTCSAMKNLLSKQPEDIVRESKCLIEDSKFVDHIKTPIVNSERLDIQVVKQDVWNTIDPALLLHGDQTEKLKKENETTGMNMDFWEAGRIKWTEEKKCTLQKRIRKLRAIDGALYICSYGIDGITVLCSDLCPLTFIKICGFGDINDVAKMNDNTLIVASEKALLHTTQTGEVLQRIKDGHFMCVWVNAGLLFAGEKFSSSIVIYDRVKNWKSTTIAIFEKHFCPSEKQKSDPFLTGLIFKSLVYACSNRESLIRVFDCNGGSFHVFDPSVSQVCKLHSPALVDIDSRGNILIVDRGIKVMNPKGEWRVVPLNLAYSPVGAVFMDSKLLVVSGNDICVYSKETHNQ